MTEKLQNDELWERIFDKYKVIDTIKKNNSFEITSRQINDFKLRDARLATKFDHRNNLPKIFQINNLSILPKSRGSYVISKFNAYKNLSYNEKIKNISISFPNHISSIKHSDLYSESISLNCAFLCGIIDYIAEDKTTHTISGRMSSSAFKYKIKNIESLKLVDFYVENSQIEIDGGYESKNKLILIEAKNTLVNDFLVRQIYYPFRLWFNKIDKEVIPIYMTYSNDIFSFFIYKFKDPLIYNSLELLEQKNFIIDPGVITINDIINVLDQTKIIPEPKLPFPQADSFERIIDLLGLLMENDLTHEDITTKYDFEPRQTDYYTNACRYLGLVEKKKINNKNLYQLNDYGRQIMSQNHKQKNLKLVQQIIKHEVFNITLKESLKNSSIIKKEETYKIMENNEIYNVGSIQTYYRRAQTINKWVNWIIRLTKKI